MRPARRIRPQLGRVEALVAPFPRKPPGMRWARYDALRKEALAAERAYLEAQEGYLPRLVRRHRVSLAERRPLTAPWLRRSGRLWQCGRTA